MKYKESPGLIIVFEDNSKEVDIGLKKQINQENSGF